MKKAEEYMEKVTAFIEDNASDTKKIIDKLGGFYQWLMNDMNDGDTESVDVFNMFDMAILWAMKNNINEKSLSDKWNGKLVSRVYRFIEDYRKHINKYSTDEGAIISGSLYNAVFKEKDFPTMLYCLKIIKIYILHGDSYASVLIPREENNDTTTPHAVEKKYQYVDDESDHYGEMMTYKQCNDMGLKTWLLWDIENHCYSNEWIKYEHQDIKLTDEEVDKEVAEMVEKVFSIKSS